MILELNLNGIKYLGFLDLLKAIKTGPGSRGGKFWIDTRGIVRYGERNKTKRVKKKKEHSAFKQAKTIFDLHLKQKDAEKKEAEKKVSKPEKQVGKKVFDKKSKTPIQDIAKKVEKPTEKTESGKANEPWEIRAVDFELEQQNNRNATYGDWFFTPDGKFVQMRGGGGLGSERVGTRDVNGVFSGYYNRNDLTVVVKKHGETETAKAVTKQLEEKSKRIAEIEKKNGKALAGVAIYEKFKNHFDSKKFKEFQDSGKVISDSEYKHGKNIQNKIQEIRDESWLPPQESVHQKIVERALMGGKPVPPEVLKDYPELQEKYGKKTEPKQEAPKTPIRDVAEKVSDAVESKYNKGEIVIENHGFKKKSNGHYSQTHELNGIGFEYNIKKNSSGNYELSYIPKSKNLDSDMITPIIIKTAITPVEVANLYYDDFKQKQNDAGEKPSFNLMGSGNLKKLSFDEAKYLKLKGFNLYAIDEYLKDSELKEKKIDAFKSKIMRVKNGKILIEYVYDIYENKSSDFASGDMQTLKKFKI